MTFTFPSTLLSLEIAEHLPDDGSSELIPCFALLVSKAFALPIKLSLSQPTRFLTFMLLILSPSHCGGNEQAAFQG